MPHLIPNEQQQSSQDPHQFTTKEKSEKLLPSTEDHSTSSPVQSTGEKAQQQPSAARQAMYADTRISILLQTAKVNIYKTGGLHLS